MPTIHDEEYAAVVERERPLMQATAYLLTGDPVQAARVVQLVVAQLYRRWPREPHPQLEAIRAVVRTARVPVNLPWEYRERVELIDGPPPVAAAEPIVADLRTLSYDQRAAVVLNRYTGLSSAQIADILELPVGDLSLAQRAQAMLAAGHPERTSDETLTEELKDAIPYELRESLGSAADVVHGRQLSRRRWLQRGSAALVAAALVVVAAILVNPTRPPVPQAAPSQPISTTTTVCGRGHDRLDGRDPSSAICRAKILLKWRSEMAEVATSQLDPQGKYFSGFGYGYTARYDTPSFWSGQGGALAFEMFRLNKGATEVYVQIATGRKFAVPCGATTHQRCMALRFMDGNRYLLTDSTVANRGIEVQYCPRGDEVITVIARNTQRGKTLDIGSGDLIKLVQDDRLHLPKR
jgi:DNA-directed RNA polymerase specialized sigma24 family protein